MNYLIFLSFAGAYSLMITLLAIIFEVKDLMNILVGVCCMMICILIFALVTGINIRIERFIFVVILMNAVNFFIFYKVGQNKWTESLQVSGISLFYTVHFLHRLGLVVEGDRLDVNHRDSIYAGLINFMDIPYYLLGILNYVIPIGHWAELNYELPLVISDQKTPASPNTKDPKLEGKKNK